MNLFAALPAAAMLMLWAAGETGLAQRVPCPAHCSIRVIYVHNHTVSSERGPQAELIAEITGRLQQTKPDAKKVEVIIGVKRFKVPADLKATIEFSIKRYPEVKEILVEILLSKVEPPRFTTTRRPRATTKKPSPKPPTGRVPPSTQKPQLPQKPKQTRRTRRTTAKTRRTQPPKKKTTKRQTQRTTKKPQPPKPKPMTTPKPPPAKPPSALIPATPKPGFQVPEVDKPFSLPPDSKNINDTVRATLELLLNFPNHFASIYKILVEVGVKFPDLRKPVHNVTIGVDVIQLPKPIVVGFTITIKGVKFDLPKDSRKIADFVSKNTAELTIFVKMLRQLGAKFSTDKTGRMAGFELLGQKEKFRHAISTQVIVGGKNFSLPKDIGLLLTFVRDKPADFFKILAILEAFDVRFDKASGGSALRAIYRKTPYEIKIVPNVRITVGARQYDIPSDLDSMLKSSVSLQIGAILKALQLAKLQVKVDKETGVIVGIVINKVLIPFPVTLDLRFKLGSKVYIVPYDLPKIIVELEKRKMPSEILSILYSRYGVVPVRNKDNSVVALSFNDLKFPIKVQPTTAVVLGGVRFVLPRDASKMVDMLFKKKVTALAFMQALQMAGYTFVPEPDGVLRTVQKGADKIDLMIEMRLAVKLDGKRYRVPNDLSRLVTVVRSLHPAQIKNIMSQLEQFGVIFARKGSKLVIMFNGIKYEVNLESGGDSGVLLININSKTFTIPKDIKAAVSYATSSGPGAVKLLVELLKAHGIKVNLSASGSIISIEFEGKVYAVGGADDSIQVTIRGKQVWIPREMLSLQKKFKNFNFAEVVVALMKKGAQLETDNESNFYGFRYKGRRVQFPKKFRVIVKVDKTGRKYRVPGELGNLAKVLSKGKWDWKAVRATLSAAGIEVAGKGGPVKSFSFQGKTFNVK